MTKRSFFVRIAVMLLLIALIVPTFALRVENEKNNKDVVFALNYNNAQMVLSEEEFDKTLERNKGRDDREGTGCRADLYALSMRR